MTEQMPKEQYEYIKRIQDDMLECTNMTENEAWVFAFRCWQCGYNKINKELEQYRALGLTPELIEAMQGHNIAMINDLAEYQALGTVEELRAKNEKLQGYRNQMSIYAEQHKIILASDVLDMLEELE